VWYRTFDIATSGIEDSKIMWSRKRIALIIGIFALAIIIGIILYFYTFALVDYWPPQGILEAERTADNTVTFIMPIDAWGADGPVKFDNCAIAFMINNQSIGPTDVVMPPGAHGWYQRTTHGCGYLNASVFTDGLVSYIIVLNDVDSDGYVTMNDTISLIATEPLVSSTNYSILFLTELRSSWSPGWFEGNYRA
jgi:hypothetical protein